MKKNDEAIITIEDIGIHGEGIGKVDGFTLFVKDAVVGDKVKVKVTKAKKQYGYARLMEIVSPSKDRVIPPCEVARQCGGCQLQALSYDKQLEFKENLVRENLTRLGGFSVEQVDKVTEKICAMENPWRYRNKAQFPVGTDREGNLVTGFYAGRTHHIIPKEDCLLGIPQNQEILERILTYMRKEQVTSYNEETHEGIVRHILIRYGKAYNQILVTLVINAKMIPNQESLVKSLLEVPGMTSISLSVNQKATNVIMGEEIIPLYGPNYILDTIGDVVYQISPLSFYQVNMIQTEKLYKYVLSYAELSGKENVWDLYCGIGTISLFLAKDAGHVHGVEIVPEAIEDAKANARRNNLNNTTFYVGKAEEVLPKYYEEYEYKTKKRATADLIVVDPPRKGCDEALLSTILQMAPPKIIYVSCDPSTLARDLKFLCQEKYELKKVQPVDQFPMSVHVETVCLLERKGKYIAKIAYLWDF